MSIGNELRQTPDLVIVIGSHPYDRFYNRSEGCWDSSRHYVAPKCGLYTPEELNRFMSDLLPGKERKRVTEAQGVYSAVGQYGPVRIESPTIPNDPRMFSGVKFIGLSPGSLTLTELVERLTLEGTYKQVPQET